MSQPTTQIYLAPFQGITGHVYREIYSRHFPYLDKLFTPFFTNVYKQKSLSRKAKELDKTSHSGIPVIPQILGNDADELARFSNICADKGFKETNWNLGCPFKRIAAKKRGSGLLPHPDLVATILEKAIPEMPIHFSIKCRLGYESTREIVDLMKVFNSFPLSEVIIHARLGVQIYKGNVDLEAFKTALELANHPVVYNGDVFEKQDVATYQASFGDIHLWMIGRGLLVDPFLPGDIKNLTDEIVDRKSKIRKFVDDLYYAYRKDLNDRLHAIHILKELWEYQAFGFNNPRKVFDCVKKTKSFDAYEDAVNEIFEKYDWVGSEGRLFNASLL